MADPVSGHRHRNGRRLAASNTGFRLYFTVSRHGCGSSGLRPFHYYAMRFVNGANWMNRLMFGLVTAYPVLGNNRYRIIPTLAINADGANGLFFGNSSQLTIQIIAVIATILFPSE